ncbi:MAG: indole-3-glycerol phosphate synthase TrpC [Acidobacteriota bacterium]|nr:indole-3-glycerol phosphate synthase TrpC [Acidobacteriota bacterium]
MSDKPTILQEIFAQKKIRVEEAKQGFEYGEFVKRAKKFRKDEIPNRFSKAFSDKSKINIIAEIKRASPSKGIINDSFDVGEVATNYQEFGATAISVLTEEDYFKGNIEDLITARNLTDLPILRKDFVFDEFQIYEAALIGADAILLIVAMLEDEDLQKLYALACDLGLDVLVETHNLEELVRAIQLGAKIIGVNNRNLHNFEVSLDVSRKLVEHKPNDVLFICESGLSNEEELAEMKELGFDGFLIGESLIKAENTGKMLESLVWTNHI